MACICGSRHISFFFLAAPHSVKHLKFPDQRLNPGPLYWELRVIITGPPGKSFSFYFYYLTEWDSEWLKMMIITDIRLFFIMIVDIHGVLCVLSIHQG